MNGDDPFRVEQRPLTAEEVARIAAIKNRASLVLDLLTVRGDQRALALARAKLEECVMWAVKGITA